MSLEDAILKLVAATEANTAAILAGGSAAAAPAAAPAAEKAAGKGKKETPAEKAAPKITRDEVNAALEQVREKHGIEEAKKIISEQGKAPKRADIAEANFQAVYDACKAKMEGGDGDDM